MKNSLGKILRVIAILLMAMTTVMNIAGGIGTSCAAFFTKNYPPYWVLIKPVDYRWLYQSLVVTTTIIGILGIIATIALIRGKKNAYRNSLIVLVIGTILGAIQYFTSLSVIGKAAPANVKFYTNVITLVFFLILAIPSLKEKVGLSKNGRNLDAATGGGLAAMVAGTAILSMKIWVGTSHVYMGNNWVDVLAWPIYITGTVLTLGGIALLAKGAWKTQPREIIGTEVQAI